MCCLGQSCGSGVRKFLTLGTLLSYSFPICADTCFCSCIITWTFCFLCNSYWRIELVLLWADPPPWSRILLWWPHHQIPLQRGHCFGCATLSWKSAGTDILCKAHFHQQLIMLTIQVEWHTFLNVYRFCQLNWWRNGESRGRQRFALIWRAPGRNRGRFGGLCF